MPQKLAVIVGSSERCMPITEQFLLSFHRNVASQTDCEIDIHFYKCNFTILNRAYHVHRIQTTVPPDSFAFQPFANAVDFTKLGLDGLNIIEHDCSNPDFVRHFPLPDIALYQDFCDKYIRDYDYAMFCHNDIVFFHKTDMIDRMIALLNGNRYDIVARTSVNFNEDISIRFHPAMIFVKTSTFGACNLSFINNYSLLNRDDFRIYTDGGAGLLASYYHNSNQNPGRPYDHIPENWFTHIRALGDTGVEFCYHYYKENMEFDRALQSARKYVDLALYA